MDTEIEEAYERLKNWSQSLSWVIDASYDQFKQTLERGTPWLQHSPSCESEAALILGQIGKKLAEVSGAYNDVRELVLRRVSADQDFSEQRPPS